MSLLGIDVGTTGCKAANFPTTGAIVASAYREYDIVHPQAGWDELDAANIWQTVKSVVREVVLANTHDPVQALAVSSLGEATVPVSAARAILGNSLLLSDARGAEYLPALRRSLPDERLYEINGNTLGNHYSLTKLIWTKDRRPALYEKTYAFLHWSGFIAFMLGAEAHVDYSLANRTLLFDVNRTQWSPELLAWAGIAGDKLPAPVPSATVIGEVAPHVAAEVGLPAHVAIVSGAHDQCANAVGCGAVDEGSAVYGMGTFICITPVFSRRRSPGMMIKQGVNTEHHAVPGQYVAFIYNQGGSLVKWYRNTFAAVEHRQAQADGEDVYPQLFAEMPAGPSGVIVLPHFTTCGPPQFIADSCGVIAGLHLDTPRGSILKGILEGATFYLKQCVDALPPTGIAVASYRAVGGGRKSDVWVQLSADILGRPLVRPMVTEAGALGAAIIAGVGTHIFSTFAQGVEAMVHMERTFEPNQRTASLYAAPYERYCRLYPILADYLRGLSPAAV